MVARAAALTATPQVQKAVLSLLIHITTDAAIDKGDCWNGLLRKTRLVTTSMSRWLMVAPAGASPEPLLRKDGERFSSIPLAGSARRQPDEALIAKRVFAPLASEKDCHEHELVTEAMKEVLRERSSELHVPALHN
ncbi:chorismate-binding protein [Shigella flexneri]